MLVDDYDTIDSNGRTDVVVVSRSASDEESGPEPLANDCTIPTFRRRHGSSMLMRRNEQMRR